MIRLLIASSMLSRTRAGLPPQDTDASFSDWVLAHSAPVPALAPGAVNDPDDLRGALPEDVQPLARNAGIEYLPLAGGAVDSNPTASVSSSMPSSTPASFSLQNRHEPRSDDVLTHSACVPTFVPETLDDPESHIKRAPSEDVKPLAIRADIECQAPVGASRVGDTGACDGVGLALHVEHGATTVEIVALPWRLAASGGLAYRSGLDASLVLEDAAVPAKSVAADAAWMRDQASGDSGFSVAPEIMASHGGTAGMYTPMPLTVDGIDSRGCAIGTSDPVATNAPTAMPWVARFMRWMEDRDGETTLWIRDFRLDEAGKREVIAQMEAALREAGCRIDRVVINGRMHWKASRFQQEKPHAD